MQARTPLIPGKFVRAEKIGAGGMAEVWKAWDSELGRWVALKFLKSDDPEERERFRREAQTAAKLAHPHIAAVYDATDDFIAMQYVEGRTLAVLPRGDPRGAVELVRQAAEAVHFAHERGVIHRDLKPGNIMASGGHAYVMDFGLAKSANVDVRLSQTGTILGTPAYMSPEQAKAGNVDRRSDVYSLGVTLYELVAGAPPFRSDTVLSLLKKVAEEEPAPLAADRDLRTIVHKCLEKDAARRYGTAKELADDLGRWLRGDPILARPPSAAYRAAKWFSKHRTAVAAGVAGLALAAGVALWLGPRITAEARAKREAEERRARQERAMKLLEEGRPALDRAYAYLYHPNARYAELVRRVVEGQKKIEAAVGIAPELALGHYLLGRAWELRAHEDRAETCWRKAAEVDPSFGPAHYQLAKLLFLRAFFSSLGISAAEMERRRAGALRWIEEAGAELARAGSVEQEIDRDTGAALAALVRGDRPAAERLAREALGRHGERDGAEDLHWILGMSLSPAIGELDALDDSLRLRPKHWPALFSRALARTRRGDRRRAIEDYTAALEIRPRLTVALLNRGILRGLEGDQDAAIADFGQALELEPDNGLAYVNRCRARERKGDLDGAVADGTEAIRLAPREPAAHFNRGVAYARRKEYEKAVGDFTNALALDPKDADAVRNRAISFRLLGRPDEALRDFSEVVALRPDDPDALVDRAYLRYERGDRTGAATDLEAALKLAPADWPERAKIERALKQLREPR
jgi:serine/threonine-protein kinase